MKKLRKDFKSGETQLKQIEKVYLCGYRLKLPKKVTDKQMKHTIEEYNGKNGLKPIRTL